PVTVTPPSQVLVFCDAPPTTIPTPGPDPIPCAIAGWHFEQDAATGTFVAARVISVVVFDESGVSHWDIGLTPAGAPTPTVMQVFPATAPTAEGRFRGALTLGSSGPTIPIQATVTTSAIALHDAAHLIAPTGTVLLQRNGSVSSTSFLGGPADARLYG